MHDRVVVDHVVVDDVVVDDVVVDDVVVDDVVVDDVVHVLVVVGTEWNAVFDVTSPVLEISSPRHDSAIR
jgi:hypothetical protein